jgi:hypothetical protein
MFQTRIHHTGYAHFLNIAVALFRANTPFIATALIAAKGNGLAPGSLLTGAALISAPIMVETAKQPHHDV